MINISHIFLEIIQIKDPITTMIKRHAKNDDQYTKGYILL